MATRLGLLIATPLAAFVAALLGAVLAWPVLLLLLLADLLVWPFACLLRQPWLPGPRDPSRASIVTVSWNGKHFLQNLLPSLQAAIEEHGGDHEVIVVDNGSVDGTAEWLAQEYPWVKVVRLPENRYFVRGNLAGVQAATRDVLVFLNNDMIVQPGFLRPLLDGLRDPRVFGVTAEVFFRDPAKRREETGRTRGEIRNGWLKLAHVLPTRDERELDLVPVFWAGGGSAAFDRRMYLAIGGFDTLYDPFYMEDTGLSWQAHRRGWQCLFTARASVLHEHRGTSRKAFGDDYVDGMIRRNQHLFLWRNITDPRLTAAILGLLPLTMLLRSKRPGGRLRGIWFEFSAFLRALPRLPEALWKRQATRRFYVRTDRQAIAQANSIVAHRLANPTALGILPVPDPVRGRRVLVLSARLPRLGVDGSWILFERLRRQARTHRLTLFAFLDRPEDAAAAEPLRAAGIEVITAVRERNRLAGNLHHRVPWRLWRDYSAPAMRAAVQRVLEGTDHELVQVEYVEMLHLLAGLSCPRPIVYTCHESLGFAAERDRLARPGLRAWFLAAQAARYEQRLLRRCARVVAISDADAAFVRSLTSTPIAVVPSGIDPAAWQCEPQVPAAPATIVFVGYWKHQPNVDAARWLVQEILPLVHAAVPAARVELIGRDVTAAVSTLAAERVIVRGFVPDLAAALAAATVVALPLRAGGGLRGKLLEAWAAGKAVVTTPVGCEGTVAVDGRDCLIADDARTFAAALVRLLRDPQRAAALGAAGRRLVDGTYSIAAAAAGYDAIYDELSGGQR
ncbi:MAG: glycosyltransferase [Planctomycetes bacterium]|nr:glycosyltransferase [Planctomycetota bacterium]